MGKDLKKSVKPIVLVDKKDRVVGFKEKFATHRIPVPLHRAISIVILSGDKTEMLITKRAITKPTWGLYWTNAVCTHPYPNESYQKTADRRIFEELGFKTPLTEAFNFTYEAEMDNKIWGEHEIDHVFTGTYDGPVKPDPEESCGYEWIKLGDLAKELKNNPKKYTPWFKTILKKL